MTRRAMTWLALPLAAALGMGACEDGGPTTPPEGPRLSVYLTDAPGDVESVWLDLGGIVVVGETNEEIDLPTELDGLILVTDLIDSAMELVDDVELEVGSFKQIRLFLDGVVLLSKQGKVFATDGAVLPDGLEADEVGELKCPSCSQSGLKIVLKDGDGAIEEGDDAAFVLDFDVAQSFGHEAGKSGKWVMRPVVHVVRIADEDVAGGQSSIAGTVAFQTDDAGNPTFSIPQCPEGTDRSIQDFVPTATAQALVDDEGNAVVRTGVVDASGDFSIGFLAPDTYTLGFAEVGLGEVKLVWTATVSLAEVTVTEGAQIEGVAYTLTGASCVASS